MQFSTLYQQFSTFMEVFDFRGKFSTLEKFSTLHAVFDFLTDFMQVFLQEIGVVLIKLR